MKKMKNLLSLVLALVMVMAMTLTAMASEAVDPLSPEKGPFSIKIENTTSGHVYEAYQIFAGDLATEVVEGDTKQVLSNITWGESVNGDKLLEALKKTENGLASVFETCENASDVAEKLSLNPDIVNKFAEIVTSGTDILTSPIKESVPETEAGGEKITNYVIKDLPAGYYLVQDRAGSLDNTNDAYTAYIMQVLANESMKPKSSVPSSEKKVQDVNDSDLNPETSTSKWQDSADYDIGDEVPFQLTGTLPETISDYTTYKMTFHDQESDGLTFNAGSVEVKLGEKKLDTDQYKVSTPGSEKKDPCTFEIIIEDVISLYEELYTLEEKTENPLNKLVITVNYTATLNENAVIGKSGNTNNMYMTFSNNPNGEGEGKTPEDVVTVFTFQLDIDKKNENRDPLNGAAFALYKYQLVTPADPENDVEEVWDWKLVKEYKLPEDDESLNQFTFKGLDDGRYKLVETETPAGYNTIDDIYFEIKAKHTEEGPIPALEELTFQQTNEAGVAFTPESKTFDPTITLSDGKAAADIINYKGVTLPETGGIGTTIFTVSGIILVIIAGVLLVTKKRMSKEQ